MSHTLTHTHTLTRTHTHSHSHTHTHTHAHTHTHTHTHTLSHNLVPVPTGPSGSLPATPAPAEPAPTVQVTPQLETKSIGASVEFHCVVPSDPGTQLRWVKEGGPLPPGHSVHDGVLR